MQVKDDILFWLSLALLIMVMSFVCRAGAGELTPNLGLTLMDYGELRWDQSYNASMNVLDDYVCRKDQSCQITGYWDIGGRGFNAIVEGAVGDGVTDDTDAILDMLDSAPDRRGDFYFPAGTYEFNESLKWGQVAAPNGLGEGFVISGAGVANTILDYTGTGWAFVINDGTGTGNVQHCVFEHLTIRINSPAMGAVLLVDDTNNCHFNDVHIIGYGKTAGYGIVAVGQRSCTCHNRFDGVVARNLLAGFTMSGYANANIFLGDVCATAGKCIDFSALAANAVCTGVGEPFACCTGAGTGDSAGLCAADTKGGTQALVERVESDGGVDVAFNLADDADGNIFVKSVADGSTASLTIADGVEGTVLVGCSMIPAPTLAGTAATSTLWIGIDPATGVGSGQTIGIGNAILYGDSDVVQVQPAAGASLGVMKFYVAGTGYTSGIPAYIATDFDGASPDIEVIMTPRAGSDDGMVGTLTDHPFQVIANDIGHLKCDGHGVGVLPLDAPTIQCDASREGWQFSNTILHVPCYCNGTDWVQADDYVTVCTTSTTTTTTLP